MEQIQKEQKEDYVGFGTRILAYGVDFLIGFLLGFIVEICFGVDPFGYLNVKTLAEYQQFSVQSSNLPILLVSLLVGACYFIFFWAFSNGATPGKKLMGIKVIRSDGRPIDFLHSVLRYFGFIISSIVLYLGYLWITFDKKKQGWHDKIADTVVVKTKEQPRTALAVFLMICGIALFLFYMGSLMYTSFSLTFAELEKKEMINGMDNLPEQENTEPYKITFNSIAKKECINDCTLIPKIKGNIFLLLDITLNNDASSKNTLYVSEKSIGISDVKGYMYLPESISSVKSFKSVVIPPGSYYSGEIVFVIPENTTNLSLFVKSNSTIIRQDFSIEGMALEKITKKVEEKTAEQIISATFTIDSIEKEWYSEFNEGEFKKITLNVANNGNIDLVPSYSLKITDAITKETVFSENNILGYPPSIDKGELKFVDLNLFATVSKVTYYNINVTMYDEKGKPLFNQVIKELMN